MHQILMSAIKTRISYTNNPNLDLSVIIVNYNVKYFLEQCLFSVIKACINIQAEIFVVDNNSTDGSRQYLENKFPRVMFKWNLTNDGFAKANNSIIGESKGDHVLFLNPDTIVPEDCFEKCLHFFKTKNDCTALGVHMIDGSGKFLRESKRAFPTALNSFFRMAGLTHLFPASKLFSNYYLGHLNEKLNSEIDVIAGAFMMISRQMLVKLNGFDEDYFMYGEDIDLSYRIQKAGYKNYYFSDTSIIHFKGESTQKRSYHYIRTFYAAMKIFVDKHYQEKKKTAFFIKLSIEAGRLAATGNLFIKNLIRINPRIDKPEQVIVLAGQQQFDEILHLIKQASVPVVVNGRISVDKNDHGIAIGKQEDISLQIKKLKIDQLIFCERDLSFKIIIETTKQLATKTGFLFHANGSQSIVGSNSKNKNGFFIAKH